MRLPYNPLIILMCTSKGLFEQVVKKKIGSIFYLLTFLNDSHLVCAQLAVQLSLFSPGIDPRSPLVEVFSSLHNLSLSVYYCITVYLHFSSGPEQALHLYCG